MQVVMVPLKDIIEDETQPRTHFSEESLQELAKSISEIGLLNPIKVRKLADGRYKIIFGNRRYKSCKMLGLEEMPCILSELNDETEIFLEQLAENIQREDFTPVEEAQAFHKLLNDPILKISKKWLGSRLGKSETYISRKLDLLIFGSNVRQLIHGGKDIVQGLLSEEQALKLKKLPVEYRDALALKVADEALSVPDTEKVASLFLDSNLSVATKEKLIGLPAKNLITVWAEHQISKTSLSEKKKDQSKIQPVQKDQTDNRTREELIEHYIINLSPLQEKVNQLNSKIPSYYPLTTSDIIHEIDSMSLDARNELLSSVDVLLNTLESYLSDWRHLRSLLIEKIQTKKDFRLIK